MIHDDEKQPEADHLCSKTDSQQAEVSRRRFMAANGVLLGAVAVGQIGISKAHAAEVEKKEAGMALNPSATKQTANPGPWDQALEKLREWDPHWAEKCLKMSTNPWRSGILPKRFIELVCIALNAACTNLNAGGIRHHIRVALDAGATREEILYVLKCSSLLAIHSCSLGAPMLLEEAKEAGVKLAERPKAATPACNKMRELGQWNTAWDPFYELDPLFTDEFMATAVEIYASRVLSPKETELLCIALDASYTHMYAPGTRRHIKAALKLGATMEEIMEVLKICVAQGVQACNLAVPILAEEMANRSATGKQQEEGAKP